MERLVTIAVFLTLLMGWGSLASAQPPADTSSPPAAASAPTTDKATPPTPKRPEPPAPPREYLEAGAKLFNKGRYELASKYLDAARMYADRLTSSEQIVLEVYHEKLDAYRREQDAAKVLAANPPKEPVVDAGVTTASAAESPRADTVQAIPQPAAEPVTPTTSATLETNMVPDVAVSQPGTAGAERNPLFGSASWRDTVNDKDKARWLLQVAREQIFKGHFELAEEAIAQAKTMHVKWTVFDETPEKMSEALQKAKAKKAKDPSNPLQPPHDRATAKNLLRTARSAIAANHLDQAEAIARDVKTWQIHFGLFDDTPDKVAATVTELRRRQAIDNAEMSVKSYRPTTAPALDRNPALLPPPSLVPPPSSESGPR